MKETLRIGTWVIFLRNPGMKRACKRFSGLSKLLIDSLFETFI
jgi:hypothetical protein